MSDPRGLPCRYQFQGKPCRGKTIVRKTYPRSESSPNTVRRKRFCPRCKREFQSREEAI